MVIRTASLADLEAVAAVEAACFPPAEAASAAEFAGRLQVYPNHFWLLETEGGELASFINGLVSDEPALRDEMYANAALHRESGAWQMIFGVATLPKYRRQGLAARVMKRVISDARLQGRRGCVLTCKEHMVSYYEKFAYRNEGVSQSVHGGAVWYDMRLTF